MRKKEERKRENKYQHWPKSPCDPNHRSTFDMVHAIDTSEHNLSNIKLMIFLRSIQHWFRQQTKLVNWRMMGNNIIAVGQTAFYKNRKTNETRTSTKTKTN